MFNTKSVTLLSYFRSIVFTFHKSDLTVWKIFLPWETFFLKYHTQNVVEKCDLYYLRLRYHTAFLKRVVLTEYSAFKSLCKMIQKQFAAAVTISLISKKNKSKKREKKKNPMWNLGLKEEKSLKILLAELWLEDEYNYNILFANDFWKLWRNILVGQPR